MKKNLRFVSAAAAALLAVAPVAATAVGSVSSTAFAASSDQNTPGHLDGTVVLNRKDDTPFTVKLSDAQKQAVLQNLGLNGTPEDMSNFQVTQATAPQSTDGVFTQTISFTFTKNGKTENHSFTVNARFAAQQGTPYFYDKDTNTVVNNGATVSLNDLGNSFTASDVLSQIQDHYAWKTSNSANTNAKMTTTAADVESQLVNQGLNRLSNGSFDYPANGFNVKLTAESDNGQTASVTVRINIADNYDAPAFVYGGNVYYNNNVNAVTGATDQLIVNGTSSNPVIKDGKFNSSAVTDAVSAYVQSAYDTNKHATTLKELQDNNIQLLNGSEVQVDSSKVNATVPGLYPVTVTATNPAGFTSKLTVYVVVNGPTQKAPVEYVVNDNTQVYNINGNDVTPDNSVKLTKGQGVYTFGSVTVNGTKYVRINKEGSNEFVKASDLSTTAPTPATPAKVNEASVSKTVMHNAYFYDNSGKRVGSDKAATYSSLNLVSDSSSSNGLKSYTINGKTYYKVANQDKYVAAGNITGTSRTLKHNAYMYKTSKKRANKKTYKKGSSVRTYGAAVKLANGKSYYRVGHTRYMKKANF